MCARLHAICITVMRAPGMMECTTIRLWVHTCVGVSVVCARAAKCSPLFPVLMMMLIICSASFLLLQAHRHTYTRTPTTTSLQQTLQQLLGHKLWFMSEGEMIWGDVVFRFLTGFTVKWRLFRKNLTGMENLHPVVAQKSGKSCRELSQKLRGPRLS